LNPALQAKADQTRDVGSPSSAASPDDSRYKQTRETGYLLDTRLTVACIYAQPRTLSMEPRDRRQVTVFGAGTPYPVTSSNPGVARAAVSGSRVNVTALRPGQATLTIRDKNSKTVPVTLTVNSRSMPVLPLLLLQD